MNENERRKSRRGEEKRRDEDVVAKHARHASCRWRSTETTATAVPTYGAATCWFTGKKVEGKTREERGSCSFFKFLEKKRIKHSLDSVKRQRNVSVEVMFSSGFPPSLFFFLFQISRSCN